MAPALLPRRENENPASLAIVAWLHALTRPAALVGRWTPRAAGGCPQGSAMEPRSGRARKIKLQTRPIDPVPELRAASTRALKRRSISIPHPDGNTLIPPRISW